MSDKGNVIMSPLLSKRLDKMEEKLNRITEDYSNINSKFDKIIEMLIQNSTDGILIRKNTLNYYNKIKNYHKII